MSSKLFEIEIIQPKFDEIYAKFQNTCDINSWANSHQEKMFQNIQVGKDINENIPKFLEVEIPQTDNKSITEFHINEDKPKATEVVVFDWGKLSPENLKIAQKVLQITLNFLQLHPINRLTLTTKIPLQKFENEQVSLEDVDGVFNKIDGSKVINTRLLHEIKEYRQTKVRFPSEVFDKDELPDYLPSEEELKNCVFLQISSLDELHRVQDLIDGKLKIDIKTDKEAQSQPNNHLTPADNKKLCVLEKLKEEWDLVPKKDKEIIKTNVSSQRIYQWENECGVDYNQLKNILQSFQDEDLIKSFNLYNPGR